MLKKISFERCKCKEKKNKNTFFAYFLTMSKHRRTIIFIAKRKSEKKKTEESIQFQKCLYFFILIYNRLFLMFCFVLICSFLDIQKQQLMRISNLSVPETSYLILQREIGCCCCSSFFSPRCYPFSPSTNFLLIFSPSSFSFFFFSFPHSILPLASISFLVFSFILLNYNNIP